MGARDKLVDMWLAAGPPHVAASIRAMTSRYGAEMWGRAAREIAAAFAREGAAAKPLAELQRKTVHLYVQPKSPEVVSAHEDLARDHPWFRFRRLEGATHFPTLETPDEVVEALRGLSTQI